MLEAELTKGAWKCEKFGEILKHSVLCGLNSCHELNALCSWSMVGVSNKRKINGRKTPSNHTRQHKRCNEKLTLLILTFLYFVFLEFSGWKITFLTAVCMFSITLNKLRSAVTNYKFKNVARSCCAVQVYTVNIWSHWQRVRNYSRCNRYLHISLNFTSCPPQVVNGVTKLSLLNVPLENSLNVVRWVLKKLMGLSQVNTKKNE